METAGTVTAATARQSLEALQRHADCVVLPGALLPGWSSLCAREYGALVGTAAAELAALRGALAAAVRAAGAA